MLKLEPGMVNDKTLLAIQKGIYEKHSLAFMEPLGVNPKLVNLLESNGIYTLADLFFEDSKEDIASISGMGEVQMNLLFKALHHYEKLKL